ncbi:hypothetical protein PZA11_001589 [Diplocarpon coronariae]|uniref:Dnase1 protein n=1 Tax=Diplocarpon coronariae TaxID=2795749 RepID=A0A218ZDT6_9HELO|nr:hypothetical protein JHW43_001969 [Diplocarpon mali]OWP05770.1 hypothetical protein B2J93_888 [Marssonina coronariae]
MQFFSPLLAAGVAAAGTVHFVNQDSTQRTIYFNPNSGLEALPELVVPGSETANQTFPAGWIGNWYSVSDGAENVPGMLGEVAFDGYAGASYFDVSAIVNPADNDGVKMIFPLHASDPVSGCQSFPCANAYNKWDDVATLSTDGSELVCLLGTVSNERRRGLVARMPRDFVTGAARG